MLKTFWDKYKQELIIAISLLCVFGSLFIIGFHVEYYVDDEAVNVVSDIAAILGVIAGISIPITLDLINRTADRYKYQELSSFFAKERLYNWTLISNILCVAISLSFKMSSVNYLGVILVLYLWFAVNLLLFVFFIYRVQYIISNTDEILLEYYFQKTYRLLGKYINNVKEGIFNTIDKNLNYFVQIGSIQVREDKDVRKLMRMVSLLLRKSLKIKRTNQDILNKLILTEDEYEYLSRNTADAFYKLSLTDRGEQRLYDTYFAVYEKIWDAAIENKNKSASRLVIEFMLETLAKLSSSYNSEKGNNYIAIDCLLRKIYTIHKSSINRIGSEPILKSTIYTTSVYWYFDIIFRDYDGPFVYKYLPIYNEWYLRVINALIGYKETDLFEEHLSYILTNINSSSYHVRTIGNDLSETLGESHRGVLRSSDALESFADPEELNKYVEDLDGLLNSHKVEEAKKEAIRNKELKYYYYRNLQELVFLTGSLCLYKNRYEYINYIWTYHENAYYVTDISLFELHDLLVFFCKKITHYKHRRFSFLDTKEKPDFLLYTKQYFLLLVARLIKKDAKKVELFKLPELNLNESNLLCSELPELNSSFEKLKENSNLIDVLDIDYEVINKLGDFLKKLNDLAVKNRSQVIINGGISDKKKDEFIKEFIQWYKSLISTRKLVEVSESQEIPSSSAYDICHSLSPINKEFFQDSSSYGLGSSGEGCGNKIASLENTKIYQKILSRSEKITLGMIAPSVNALLKKSDNILILATKEIILEFFEKREDYINRHIKPKYPFQKGFLVIDNNQIPVYCIDISSDTNTFIITTKESLGTIIQYVPQVSKDNKEDKIDGYFVFKFRDASQDKELFQQLKNDPFIFKKQPEELAQYMSVEIFEKFEYKPAKDFEGYKVTLKNDIY